jgi:hypothetical protein
MFSGCLAEDGRSLSFGRRLTNNGKAGTLRRFGLDAFPKRSCAGKCFTVNIMKTTIAKRNRKVRRMRKLMQQAHRDDVPWIEDPREPSHYEPHAHWPAYMKRALPLPDFGS